MDADSALRLELLVAACKAKGLMRDDGVRVAPTKLAAALGKSVSQVSDMLRGQKSFGPEVAREIEEKLHLARWQLDGGPVAPTAPAVVLSAAEQAGVLAFRSDRPNLTPLALEVASALDRLADQRLREDLRALVLRAELAGRFPPNGTPRNNEPTPLPAPDPKTRPAKPRA
jgi:hypothetical protein